MNVFRYKQFDIQQEHAAMKVGTDSDLLGTLAEGGRDILDIGTGTGVISLMLAQRYPEATITAVEIDDNAVIDARVNFSQSKFAERITLHHQSFQEYLDAIVKEAEASSLPDSLARFDCVVCNPPYFDKSLECDDLGRTRARHTSSLPFDVLAGGAYRLLKEGGVFSVCIPGEVLEDFCTVCTICGFWLKDLYKIKSVPEKEAKRYVLVHQKGKAGQTRVQEFCMRNSDRSRSEWYKEQLKDFLL